MSWILAAVAWLLVSALAGMAIGRWMKRHGWNGEEDRRPQRWVELRSRYLSRRAR